MGKGDGDFFDRWWDALWGNYEERKKAEEAKDAAEKRARPEAELAALEAPND